MERYTVTRKIMTLRKDPYDIPGFNGKLSKLISCQYCLTLTCCHFGLGCHRPFQWCVIRWILMLFPKEVPNCHSHKKYTNRFGGSIISINISIHKNKLRCSHFFGHTEFACKCSDLYLYVLIGWNMYGQVPLWTVFHWLCSDSRRDEKHAVSYAYCTWCRLWTMCKLCNIDCVVKVDVKC